MISLLIMSSLLITSSLVSIIIMRGLRFSKDTESGMVAFYAAESGIEDALYNLRKVPDVKVVDLNREKVSLANSRAVWDREAYDKTVSSAIDEKLNRSFFYDILYKDYLVVLDLYNNDAAPSYGAGVSLLEFTWSSGTALKVTRRRFDSAEGKLIDDFITPDVLYCENVSCKDSVSMNPGDAYELTIEAWDNINDLKIEAFSDTGGATPVDFNLPLTVKSIGSYGDYRQGIEMKLKVKTPW